MKDINKKIKYIKNSFISCIDIKKLKDFMRFYDISTITTQFNVKFTTNDDGFSNDFHAKFIFSKDIK